MLAKRLGSQTIPRQSCPPLLPMATAVLNVLCGATVPPRDWLGALEKLKTELCASDLRIAFWDDAYSRPASELTEWLPPRRSRTAAMRRVEETLHLQPWRAEAAQEEEKNAVLASELLLNPSWVANGLVVLGSEEELFQVPSMSQGANLRCVLFEDDVAARQRVAEVVASSFALTREPSWMARCVGNVCDAPQRILAHQVSLTVNDAQGLAAEMFKRFRAADQYRDPLTRAPLLRERELFGTCRAVSCGDKVVGNLFGQVNGGAPWMEGDGAEERTRAFRSAFQSLCQLARRLGCGVAVPFLIGCARGGGVWEEYFDMVEDEAGRAGVEVHVYAGTDMRFCGVCGGEAKDDAVHAGSGDWACAACVSTCYECGKQRTFLNEGGAPLRAEATQMPGRADGGTGGAESSLVYFRASFLTWEEEFCIPKLEWRSAGCVVCDTDEEDHSRHSGLLHIWHQSPHWTRENMEVEQDVHMSAASLARTAVGRLQGGLAKVEAARAAFNAAQSREEEEETEQWLRAAVSQRRTHVHVILCSPDAV